MPDESNKHADRSTPASRPGRGGRHWLLLILIVGLGASWLFNTSQRPDSSSSPIPWVLGLDAGLEQAARTGKPIFLDFTADWCPPCQAMERDVYSQPEVIRMLADRFIPVKVDLTRPDSAQRAAAQQHQVAAIPTLIVATPDGTPVSRWEGYLGADELDAWLQAALARLPSQPDPPAAQPS